MSLVLGIDTGGTCTDGVIVDNVTKKIVRKAKTPTTRGDLTIGIRNCINALDFVDYDKIDVVSLSTTLATNAIVEGRGGEVGLIIIGHEPKGKLPTDNYVILFGETDIKGRHLSDLKEEEIYDAIEHFKGKVDAIAISGYSSVRNPEHELRVKKIVRARLALPVVCAHELTTSLGFYERSVTVVLNAKLIPIISKLLESINSVLKEKNIKAPVMIVKSDGSLMSEALSREKPIDTILSGPAASMIGGVFLTGISDAVVLDMGGTTTDIAVINDHTVKINREGALVGGWLTRVKAAEIYTYGVGGDSCLQLTASGRLKVGPQRVLPLCVLGYSYPELVKEMKTHLDKNYKLRVFQASDSFLFLRQPNAGALTDLDKNIIELLKQGPRSLNYLCKLFDRDADLSSLERLVSLGVLARASVTPTDILHAAGTYNRWDREAARVGIEILAERMGKTVGEFIEMALDAVVNEICLACLQSLKRSDGKESYYIKKPIVAVGAPVRAWLGKVAEKLNTELIIPEHSEVASAVGAAVGKIVETITIIIRPGAGRVGFVLHAPWERKYYNNLDDAVADALAAGKKKAAYAAEKAGTKNYQLILKREDIYTDTYMTNEKIYIETRIEIAAAGNPG